MPGSIELTLLVILEEKISRISRVKIKIYKRFKPKKIDVIFKKCVE